VRVDVVHHAELQSMHNRSVKYSDKTEIVYSALQILTAAFASFAHGSNDIANAVGPLSTIWAVYDSGYQLTVSSKTETPIWVVLICTVGLDLGLFTYWLQYHERAGEQDYLSISCTWIFYGIGSRDGCVGGEQDGLAYLHDAVHHWGHIRSWTEHRGFSSCQLEKSYSLSLRMDAHTTRSGTHCRFTLQCHCIRA